MQKQKRFKQILMQFFSPLYLWPKLQFQTMTICLTEFILRHVIGLRHGIKKNIGNRKFEMFVAKKC